MDASGFDGNLATTGDNTVQKVAQKLDDLTLAAGGDDAAPWAEAGNTDKIPDDKLPANPLDVIALDVTQTFVDLGGDTDAGGLTNALRIPFNVDGVGFEIRRILFDNTDSKLIIDFDNFNDANLAALRLATLTIGGVKYHPADGTADPYDSADITREIEWARVGDQPAPGDMRVRVDDLRIVSEDTPGIMSPAQYVMLENAAEGGTPDDDSVSTAKIQDLAVTTAKLADNAVTTGKIAAGAVATSDIGDDQITAAKIATNAVTADGLADGAVDAFAIENGAVTESKLAASAVTTSKMATEATQRLVPSGGTTGQVLKKTGNNDYAFGWGTDNAGTGGGGGLDQDAVDARIAAYGRSFTAAEKTKLAGIETGATADQDGNDIRNLLENLTGANKLPGTALEDGSIETEQLADDAVTQAKIGPGAVGTTELAANAVTTAQIASQTILGSRMGSNSVGSRVIADGAVTTGKIGNLAVQEGKIADSAVTAGKINNGAVTEGKLGALAVTAAKIAGGAVSLAKAGADLVARLVPTGGSDKQVLTRTGATGFGWADAASGGGQTLAETLLDRTAVGVTFSDAGADRLGVPVYLPLTTYSLTDQTGVFFLDLEFAFSGSSITNFGFTSGSPGDATASQDHNFTASALLATDPFVAGGDLEGVRYSQDVYSGSTKIGTVDWRTTRLANGQIGYYLSYDAGAGHSATGGATVTVTATLAYLPTDAGSGSGGGGPVAGASYARLNATPYDPTRTNPSDSGIDIPSDGDFLEIHGLKQDESTTGANDPLPVFRVSLRRLRALGTLVPGNTIPNQPRIGLEFEYSSTVTGTLWLMRDASNNLFMQTSSTGGQLSTVNHVRDVVVYKVTLNASGQTGGGTTSDPRLRQGSPRRRPRLYPFASRPPTSRWTASWTVLLATLAGRRPRGPGDHDRVEPAHGLRPRARVTTTSTWSLELSDATRTPAANQGVRVDPTSTIDDGSHSVNRG